jgi:hypothetical protein
MVYRRAWDRSSDVSVGVMLLRFGIPESFSFAGATGDGDICERVRTVVQSIETIYVVNYLGD